MYCLKCGKEIDDKQVFCKDCLAVMEKFPVKPETKIFLLRTASPVAAKKSTHRKRSLSPDERILRMKKAIQLLSVMLAVSVLALFLTIALLVESVSTEAPQDAIGQNYGTINDVDPGR